MVPPSSDDITTVLDDRLALSPSPTASFRVVVDPHAGPTTTLEIRGDEPGDVIVGQSPVCTLRLADPLVSRRHLALDVSGDRLRVRDLGSRNGTFIGALRVVEALAGPGDVITVGRTTLRLEGAGPGHAALPATDHFGPVIGFSREMRRLFPLMDRLGHTTIPVLIEGETGTGKEVVAQALHGRGARASKPFVLFDCTALAANVIESELFGHEKGAFTGATGQRVGVFEEAHEGTLFIDEIGDLALELQAKLLRAIDTGQVRRVGGNRWIRCDVRIVAATRRNLDVMVQEGRFRDDLYHRLAVGRLALPPLRERRGDVSLLVDHFCREQGAHPSALKRELVEAWRAAAWPGNVRELRNAVERALALGELGDVGPPPSVRPEDATVIGVGRAFEQVIDALLPYEEARAKVLALFQRTYVERMMLASEGSVQRAAALSGLALRYFQQIRARYKVRTGP